jgi:hypothetical protein
MNTPETAELEPGPIAADAVERIVEHILASRFRLTERARDFLEDLQDRAGRFPARSRPSGGYLLYECACPPPPPPPSRERRR